jgi:DNA-binding SARP family transcriptional activator/tetratricopeptide (TPR) repeat protein/DNA-binding XRE family transcriptional regulator
VAGRRGDDQGTGPGGLVRVRRLASGLTQEELAELAGVSVGALRDLEQGRTRRPHARLVERLTQALGLEVVQGPGLPGTRASTGDGRTRPAANGNGLWLRVLGPLAAWRDGVPLELGEPRQRAVLAVLALNAGTSVHRDMLVDAVWGQEPPAAAVNLIQAYVGRLRRVLDFGRSPRDPAGIIVSTGTSYRLRMDADQLDWLAFRDLVGRAAAACSIDDGPAGCRLYARAVELWQGEPLADIDALRGRPSVAMVGRAWAAAVGDYAEAAIAAGCAERVLQHVWALTERDPLNEKAHALLMLALAATGQQAAALRLFDDIRHRLDAHLGIRPGRELQDAHLRILRQEIPVGGRRGEIPVAGGVVARQLPARVPRLAGRIDELKALTDLVGGMDMSGAPGGTVPIAVINGTPGIGKTTLAVHWAHAVAHRFPDGQLYADLRGFDLSGSPLSTAEAVRGFLDALRVPVERIPAGVQAQVGLYRSMLAGRRILVVLDNARDSAQVRPLLPASPTCLVVVTSRSELTGLMAAEGAHPVTLGLLDTADARHLLSCRLGAARVAAEPGAVDALVDMCAGLPLALSIVGARAAAHPDFPLVALVSQLRDARGRLDAFSAGDAAGDLRAVFFCSYQHLSAAASRLFRLLGVHPGPDISLPAAASLAGVPRRRVCQLLDELTRAHLLDEGVPGRYRFHDLLRAYARELADTGDGATEGCAAFDRVLDHYLYTAHAAARLLEPHREPISLAPARPGVSSEVLADNDRARAWFSAEHLVLLAAIRHTAQARLDTYTWQLAWTLASFLERQGHWPDWVATQEAALTAARRLADQPAQAVAHRLLGRAYTRLGRYEEANAHLQRAAQAFGDLGDHDGQARTYHDLAIMSGRQIRYRDALDHAQRALDLRRGTGHRVWQARALNTVGWYHVLLGEYPQALNCCGEALALHQEFGDRQGEAHTLDTLGYTHHHLGQHRDAVACYQRALEVFRAFGDHYEEADTLTRLGDTHKAAEDLDAARCAWQHALSILTDLGHPVAGTVRTKLHDLAPR